MQNAGWEKTEFLTQDLSPAARKRGYAVGSAKS
jgi:hypothetical protein